MHGQIPYENIDGLENSEYDDEMVSWEGASGVAKKNRKNRENTKMSAAQHRKMRELQQNQHHSDNMSTNNHGRHIYTSLFDPVSCLPIYVHKAVVSLNHDRAYERDHQGTSGVLGKWKIFGRYYMCCFLIFSM